MKRIFSFPSLLAILLAVLVCAPKAGAQDHHDHGDHDEDHTHMETMENVEIANPDVILHVDGMHCEHCAYSLRRELDNLEAVNQTQVIVEDDQQIRIALNEGQPLTEENIQEAVRASGFEEEFELKGITFAASAE